MTESLRSNGRANLWIAPRTETRALLSEADLARLETLMVTRVYRKGQAVFRAGEPADAFYLVLTGGIKIAVPGTLSGDRIVAVSGPSDLFGSSACATRDERSVEAVSVEDDTRIAVVSCDQFREISRQVPGVAVAVTDALAERVQTLEDALAWTMLPSQLRLARTFLSLVQRFGVEVEVGVMEFALDLKQYEIASLAGTTRVSATRALSSWRDLGVVEGTRGFYRVNVVKLTSLAELLEQDLADPHA